jgi:hypothetical protein
LTLPPDPISSSDRRPQTNSNTNRDRTSCGDHSL